MALTGQAKTNYQREYMRKRRRSVRPIAVRPEDVVLIPIGSNQPDPISLDLIRPTMQDNVTERMYEHNSKPKEGLAPDGFPIQHTNSMKVGYVPAK